MICSKIVLYITDYSSYLPTDKINLNLYKPKSVEIETVLTSNETIEQSKEYNEYFSGFTKKWREFSFNIPEKFETVWHTGYRNYRVPNDFYKCLSTSAFQPQYRKVWSYRANTFWIEWIFMPKRWSINNHSIYPIDFKKEVFYLLLVCKKLNLYKDIQYLLISSLANLYLKFY